MEEAAGVAVRTLKAGGIVAYPTETFYGLGVKFDMEDALQRLYALKRRPVEKTVSLIIDGPETLAAVALSVNDTARKLIERFWPGPLTILFPAKETLSGYIKSLGKVAVRMPGESFALYLARTAGFPVTATSANPAGMPPAGDADTVIEYFGESIDLVVDVGRTPGGLPSTVVDVTENRIKIIRQGGVRAVEGS